MTADPSLVVAFRTHLWDRDIARLAAKLAEAAGAATFVVLADETAGALDVAPFTKVAHDNNYAAMGLPNFPADKVLWYNADYPLYTLRSALPQASHYAMVEYDVAVNVDFHGIMQTARSGGIDLITDALRVATPDWYWICTGADFFKCPLQSFLPVVIASARAIDHMLARRREIWNHRPLGIFEDWPFCEIFIPTAIAELAGSTMRELAGFARLEPFNLHEALHINNPAAHRPGTICHRVLGGAAFAIRELAKYDAVSVFDANSALRSQIIHAAPAEFLPVIARRINALNDEHLFQHLIALAASQNWPACHLRRNIAYGKPALQSSVDAASHSQHPPHDAQGGNNGQVTGRFGFHTGREQDPWWQVDLQRLYAVEEIVLFNRLDLADRAARLAIYFSTDGEQFHLAAAKLDAGLFGGADGRPYRRRFTPALPARYIRVGLIGETYLHLDEIEIFGDEL